MSYEVLLHPAAVKEFDGLPAGVQRRVAAAIDGLREEPRPQGAVKLAGVDAHRIRVGEYRVVYAIKDQNLVVLVLRLAHRSDVYRQMESLRRRLESTAG